MDIDALHSTLLSISLVSDKLRTARENLPANRDVPAWMDSLLLQAESDLRMAKATLAGELGFRLCPRCWPPEFTTTDRDGRVILSALRPDFLREGGVTRPHRSDCVLISKAARLGAFAFPDLQSKICHLQFLRGHSSVGRAPALQAGSQGFESPCLQSFQAWSQHLTSRETLSDALAGA